MTEAQWNALKTIRDICRENDLDVYVNKIGKVFSYSEQSALFRFYGDGYVSSSYYDTLDMDRAYKINTELDFAETKSQNDEQLAKILTTEEAEIVKI